MSVNSVFTFPSNFEQLGQRGPDYSNNLFGINELNYSATTPFHQQGMNELKKRIYDVQRINRIKELNMLSGGEQYRQPKPQPQGSFNMPFSSSGSTAYGYQNNSFFGGGFRTPAGQEYGIKMLKRRAGELDELEMIKQQQEVKPQMKEPDLEDVVKVEVFQYLQYIIDAFQEGNPGEIKLMDLKDLFRRIIKHSLIFDKQDLDTMKNSLDNLLTTNEFVRGEPNEGFNTISAEDSNYLGEILGFVNHLITIKNLNEREKLLSIKTYLKTNITPKNLKIMTIDELQESLKKKYQSKALRERKQEKIMEEAVEEQEEKEQEEGWETPDEDAPARGGRRTKRKNKRSKRNKRLIGGMDREGFEYQPEQEPDEDVYEDPENVDDENEEAGDPQEGPVQAGEETEAQERDRIEREEAEAVINGDFILDGNRYTALESQFNNGITYLSESIRNLARRLNNPEFRNDEGLRIQLLRNTSTIYSDNLQFLQDIKSGFNNRYINEFIKRYTNDYTEKTNLFSQLISISSMPYERRMENIRRLRLDENPVIRRLRIRFTDNEGAVEIPPGAEEL